MVSREAGIRALIEYYERRAAEYDATAWELSGGDKRVARMVKSVLTSLMPARTLDIGCGTGYVSRWLPGDLTLLDSSPSMLAIARRRLPQAAILRSAVPPLPVADNSYGRAFTANFYGHLLPEERRYLVSELKRVSDELLVLEQLSDNGAFREGSEERELVDGTRFTIHKCYFTVERLQQEIGGGELLMNGPTFAILRQSVIK